MMTIQAVYNLNIEFSVTDDLEATQLKQLMTVIMKQHQDDLLLVLINKLPITEVRGAMGFADFDGDQNGH